MTFRRSFSRKMIFTSISRKVQFPRTDRLPALRWRRQCSRRLPGHRCRGGCCNDGRDYAPGGVLPIGGLKEKLLAAKNAGVRTVCVPKKNEKDVEEMSGEIKKGLEIVYVETMEQVLRRFLRKKEVEHGHQKCKILKLSAELRARYRIRLTMKWHLRESRTSENHR